MKRRTWVALGLLAYIGLPYLLMQRLGLGLIREGRQAERAVALTFDDGPDPRTTPAVLDALREGGARATFFVMADRAEAHPELIRRMLTEGHEVGAHGARHRHAWWRSPWGAFRDPAEAARRVSGVVGRPVRLHRPPHGGYTLATVLGQRAAGLTGAHWSVEGRDWHPGATPESLRSRLRALMRPGAVVVLHDAGPGARVTGPGLPGLLADLRARGYQMTPLGELEGAAPLTPADLPRRAMGGLDALLDHLGGVRYAGGRSDGLFRVGRVRFPLAGITLMDGTPVLRGTPAAEFHVNNPLMVDLGLRRSVRLAREDFRDVARDLVTRPELRGAEVVFCLSALSPLLATLGFETHDLPPATTRRLHLWARVLRRAYGSPPGAPEPKLSVMGRRAFLERYGTREAGGGTR